MDTWKYYRNAMMPSCLPHEEPDISVLSDKNIWKKPPWNKALFAKYTTDYDRPEEGEWYWCIKDTPFDISVVKAKVRYEINKGLQNFEVKEIDPNEHIEALYEVAVDSFASYPEIYRAQITFEGFKNGIPDWKKPCFAAFSLKDGKLCGYINMVENGKAILYSGQATIKAYEKENITAVLIYGMLEYYKSRLENGEVYIVDGERNINHITNHQDYLIRKFQFRKAYCKLNISYRPFVYLIVCVLYPFRKILKKLDLKSKIIHKINGVLLLENIVRKQK